LHNILLSTKVNALSEKTQVHCLLVLLLCLSHINKIKECWSKYTEVLQSREVNQSHWNFCSPLWSDQIFKMSKNRHCTEYIWAWGFLFIKYWVAKAEFRVI